MLEYICIVKGIKGDRLFAVVTSGKASRWRVNMKKHFYILLCVLQYCHNLASENVFMYHLNEFYKTRKNK